MKKSLLVLLTSMTLALGSSAFADTTVTKIGVVDFNKVLLDSPQLTAAKNDLKKQFDPREKAIMEEQKKFQTTIEAFNKNSPTMKAEEKEKAQRNLMEQQKKIQEMQEKFQKDVGDTQNKVMGDLSKKIQGIVDKIAADQKFDLVLVKAGTPFCKKDLDITDEVLKQLKNKK